MRMFFNADSSKNIGYTPDWVHVTFQEDGVVCELIFDVQGDIEYNDTKLCCCVRGELMPWVLRKGTEEIDYSEMCDEERQAIFSPKRILEIFRKGTEFIVGVYPTDDTNPKVKKDVLTDGNGSLKVYIEEIDEVHDVQFKFETECDL